MTGITIGVLVAGAAAGAVVSCAVWWSLRGERQLWREDTHSLRSLFHRGARDRQSEEIRLDSEIRRLDREVAAIRAGLAAAVTPRATDAPGAMRPPECEERGECPDRRHA